MKKLLLLLTIIGLFEFQSKAQYIDAKGEQTNKSPFKSASGINCPNNSGIAINVSGTSSSTYNTPNTSVICNTPVAVFTGAGSWTGGGATGIVKYTFSQAVTCATVTYTSVNKTADIGTITIDGGGTLSLSNVCGATISGNILTCNLPGNSNPYGDVSVKVSSTSPFTTIKLTNTGGSSGWVQGNPCNFILTGCLNKSCCDSIDAAKIEGPVYVACGFKEAKFCYKDCKDAKYDWSITNGSGASVGSFTGQGTNCIVLNSRKQLCEGKYLVTLKITCNNKVITKTFSFAVTAPQNCAPTYLLSTTETSTTGFNLVGIPSSSTTGLEHGFLLQEITTCGGTTGAFVGFNYYNAAGTMAFATSGITSAGSSNNGFTYSNLSKGKCYTLAHYVKCCCQWKCIKKCICFSNASCDNINSANKTMSSTETISDIEFKELPKEIQEAALKNNK